MNNYENSNNTKQLMRIVIEVWAKDGSPHGKKGENKGCFDNNLLLF